MFSSRKQGNKYVQNILLTPIASNLHPRKLNTKLKLEGLQNPLSFDINIMDEDFRMVNELTLLTSNI
jgi:hypothetical protein